MPLDLGKLKEKMEKRPTERADRFNFKDGDNYIRILPPSLEYFAESIEYICFEYGVHFNLGADGDKTAEVCPKSLDKHSRCPICEVVSRFYRTGKDDDKAIAGQLRARTRCVFNVVDLNNPDKGIQIMETGIKIYEDIVKFMTNPKWGDLLDLDEGRNITITKTSAKETSSGYTEYTVAPDPNICSIREKLPKNFKEGISLLKKSIPQAKSYDELKVILEGGTPSDENTPSVTTSSVKHEVQTNKEIMTDSKVDAKSTVKVKEEAPTTKEKPSCFGNDYGPNRDVCKKCSFIKECRIEFLNLG